MRRIGIGLCIIGLLAWGCGTDRKTYEGDIPPQSGQFYKNKMTDQVVVADCRRDTPIGRMTATALQGLVNQDTARVYLYLADHHVRQLNDTKRNFQVLPAGVQTRNPGLKSLFGKYASRVKTIYLWNPEEEWTWNMAVMLSAHNQGIPLTAGLKEELLDGLAWEGKTENLQGRWASKGEAYEWAMKEILPRSHPSVLFSVGLRSDWVHNPWTLYDYAVASKGFAFWLDDADSTEQQIIRQICQKGKYRPGSIVMGYAKSGDDLLTTVNQYGIGYVVSDYYSNGSFWCSYPNKSFKQRPGVALEKVEAGKVYVSIIFSDGDNLQFDQNALYAIWTEDSLRGDIPVGTTLAAGLQEINPFLLEWYYIHKSDNDELVAGPAGFQFRYGRDEQEEGYDEWLELNRKWLASAGFSVGCLWHTTFGTDRFDRYIKTSGLKGIFDGDDKTGTVLQDGVIIMNQGAHLVQEGDMYNSLVYHTPVDSTRPLFINLYPTAATYGYHGIARLKREMARLEAEFPGKYVYLLPGDLVATARRYFERKNVKTSDK